MNNLIIKKDISKMIYNLNGIKIILDEDLASLMNIDTKRLNETIRRNKDKFYEKDYFKLTLEEYKDLKKATFNSNFATSSLNFATSSLEQYGGRRYSTYAFARDAIITLLELKIGRENSEVLEEVIDFLEEEKNKCESLENPIITEDSIKNMIYEIRGKQVILDYDLARLYKCTNGTKTINLAVKRNAERFPEDFYFKLTEEETLSLLRFQIETSKINGRGGRRYSIYAFSEEGVAMLSSVLNTKVADEVSVYIMRAFVAMRKYISSSILEQGHLKDLIYKHDKDIIFLKEAFENLQEKEVKNSIYFDGQIYDAYSAISKIFSKAKKELIIIDGYADRSVLDMIKMLKLKVIIITKNNSKLSNQDISVYHKQYNNLRVIYNDSFHDRFFIIDEKEIYHCGTSINHAGLRTFAINRLEEDAVIDLLIKKVKTLM